MTGLLSRMGNESDGWSLLWDWQLMCGPDGLSLWSVKHRDLGICFQELCLQLPVLTLLAILSAFYCGKQAQQVVLNQRQHWILDFRGLVTFLLILAPIVRVCIAIYTYQNLLFVVDYLLPVVEVFTWLVHLGFIHTLKRQPDKSSRGPVFLCVVWTLGYVLCAISLHSRFVLRNGYQYPELTPFLTLSYGFNICSFILQSLYTITLLPSYTSDTSYEVPNYLVQNSERQALLGSPQVGAYSRFREERDPLDLGVAMEDSTFLGRFFFCWVNPLMNKGVKEKLNQADDLYDLPMEITPSYIYNQLEEAMSTNKIKRKPMNSSVNSYGSINGGDEISFCGLADSENKRPASLLRALHSCFALHFYGIGILKLIADCAGFIAPFFLNKLVTFIENKDEPIHNGYLYAAGLFVVTLTSSFCNSHFSFQMSIVGLKIRAALVTRIYRKTLTLSSTALGAFSLGEIVNFMSTDTDRVVNSCPSFHSLWSIPFQISITLYLLYNQVGLAFLAGVGFTIILIPINKLIASKIGSLSTTLMARKDERVKMMAEVIRGIRVLKLQVWEEHFVKKIGKLREMELKYLRGRKYLDALCVYFWATTPVLISILTFTTYVLMGNRLTAATVFTSIALLNMLIAPLNAFPWVLNGLTEAWVSLKRIQRLLEVPDLDLESYYSPMENTSTDVDILVKDATFSWGDRPEQEPCAEDTTPSPPLILNNIHLTIKKGHLIGVMGNVGSGKSSLLAALLAEIDKINGTVSLSDLDVGYGFVSQQPWLQRGTIRDNILFGKTYDATRYKAVLEACCLEEDLKCLPGGDLAGIGEGGMTLSGGQKARVALARAVYQDRNIYFLDDIMSAVDVHVARHIFQRCINTLLRNKTRILCTHHPQYLLLADHIIVLDEGKIIEQGKPAVVLSDYDDYLSPSDSEPGEANGSSNLKSQDDDTLSLGGNSMLDEESREVGTVRLDIYASYWRSVGHVLSALIIVSMVLMQASRNMTDWWLSYWVTHISGPTNMTNVTGTASDPGIEYYLVVYAILAAANSVFTLLRAFLFAYGGIQAASSIHKLLLKTVIKARCSFFDVTPLGRILNRFSSDTYTIDDSLPFIMNILLAQLFSLVGTLVIVIYGLPWLVLILAPLVPVYHWLQNQYRLTSRELKRLSSVTLSPVYNHFNETLLGLATIRAFRAVPRFKHINESNLEENLKCQLASQAAAQWLGLRLQFIGVAIVTGVGLISVLQHQFDVADPGWVGLAISYSLSITGMLSGVVNAFTETEKEMIAVERAYEYINQVPPESSEDVSAPYAWPSQGVVAFDGVVLKYRDHLSPALRGVSFETRPAEKVGVVGRTGAGKSSLMQALFRLTEVTDGEVIIDTVNIALIGLKELRSRLAVIPQDPFLFSGTVRENIDPLGQYRDPELWTALQRCHLAAAVKKMGGMGAQLGPSGQNLSMGQRQLLCLVRAVLHNAKILCIDEATAHVDQETDRHIQRTLRTSFRQSTVITIAHRVRTIMDSDRVLVMGDGEVLEFECPDVLMQDKDSHFYKLARQQFQ